MFEHLKSPLESTTCAFYCFSVPYLRGCCSLSHAFLQLLLNTQGACASRVHRTPITAGQGSGRGSRVRSCLPQLEAGACSAHETLPLVAIFCLFLVAASSVCTAARSLARVETSTTSGTQEPHQTATKQERPRRTMFRNRLWSSPVWLLPRQ